MLILIILVALIAIWFIEHFYELKRRYIRKTKQTYYQ